LPPTQATRHDPGEVGRRFLEVTTWPLARDELLLPRRLRMGTGSVVLIGREILGPWHSVEKTSERKVADVMETVPILDRGADLAREIIFPVPRLRPIGEDEAPQDDDRHDSQRKARTEAAATNHPMHAPEFRGLGPAQQPFPHVR
jgi:hypothetical protein